MTCVSFRGLNECERTRVALVVVFVAENVAGTGRHAVVDMDASGGTGDGGVGEGERDSSGREQVVV